MSDHPGLQRGYALRFHEDDVARWVATPAASRASPSAPMSTWWAWTAWSPGPYLLVVTSSGVGKRTPLTEYPTYKRGAGGVITIQLLPEKHGRLVGVKAVTEGNDLMLVSEQGVLIRIPVEEVRRSGRNTQGVQLMNLDANDRVSAVAQVVTRDEE